MIENQSASARLTWTERVKWAGTNSIDWAQKKARGKERSDASIGVGPTLKLRHDAIGKSFEDPSRFRPRLEESVAVSKSRWTEQEKERERVLTRLDTDVIAALHDNVGARH